MLAEKQTGFIQGRSTVQQVFNSQVIIEKHLQLQLDLFHSFIDFKTAFHRAWHAGLWQVVRRFNKEEDLVRAIKALYENFISTVLLNNQHWEFYKTTVVVRQVSLL